MLADWYFCNCIGLQAEQTLAFLKQLDALDHPNVGYADAGHWALPAALRSLAKSDPWRQLYALPRVLHARRTASETKYFENQLADYTDALVEILPEDLRSDMVGLLESVLRGNSRSVTTEVHATAAMRALRHAGQGETRVADRDGPYLDSDAFAPEIIILAFLADNLTLIQALKSANGAILDSFIAEALAGLFGRLAFGLALRISAEESDSSSAIELILSAKGCPVLEPDLSLWLAKYALSGEIKTARFVLKELSSFEALYKYHDRWAESVVQTGAMDRAALRRLRLENRPEVANCWKMICWQWALATTLASVDAAEACRIFGKRWQPRGSTPRRRIVRVSQQAIPERTLIALNLAADAQQLNVAFEHPPRGEEAPTSTESLRDVLSPWFPEGATILRRPPRGQDVAPAVVWLGNLAGAFVAGLILTDLDRSSVPPHEDISAELASLADLVASTFLIARNANAELSTRRNREKQTPLEALARFTHGYFERLGRGYYGNLGDFFLHPTHKCAPAACVHWFEETLFEHGTGRSNLITSLVALRALPGPPPLQQQDAFDKAFLISKFVLTPDERSHVPPRHFVKPEDREKRARDCARKIDRALAGAESERLPDIGHDSHRVLLMLDPAEIERLFGFVLGKHERTFRPFRARLSLAILGFLTAIRLPDLALADKLDVISALIELLAASTSPEAIDVYVADRLVAALQATLGPEIINDSSLRGPIRELREGITLAILEYGRSTQVASVIDALFDVNDPSQEHGWLITGDLRPAALAGFLSLVRSAEEYVQSEHENDPWSAVEYRFRLVNMRRQLRGILSAALYKSQKGLPGGAVLGVFRHWLRQRDITLINGLSWTRLSDINRGKKASDSFQPALFDRGLIVDRSNGEVFALQSNRASWPDKSINIGACRLPDVVNPFLDGDTNPTLGKDQSDVLGIVCEQQPLPAERGEPGTYAKLKVNVGSEALLVTKISASRVDAFQPGDPCIVSVKMHDRGYLIPTPTEPRSVRVEPVEGQVFTARVVTETSRAGVRSIRVKWRDEPYLPQDVDISKSERNVERWIPDISWCFDSRATSEAEWTCLVQISAAGDPPSLMPVDRGLESLLIDEFAAQNETVLCFVGLSESGAEWRFSTRPGRNYLIDPADFGPTEREAIAARLSGEDARGLLIRVSWSHRGGCLKFIEQNDTPQFDDRNLQWRKIFEENEHLLATRDSVQGRGWIIELPETKLISGFPARLLIGRWKDKLPGSEAQQAEVVPDWSAVHQRTAVIEAVALAQAWSLPRDEKKALDILRRVAFLRHGEILELRKPPDAWPRPLRPENNLYPYWAEGGIPVEVEPESITLGPWSDRPPREVDGRRARVSNSGFFAIEAIEIEGDLKEVLPSALPSGELRGVLTDIPLANAKLNVCTVHWLVDGGYEIKAIRIRNFRKLRRCRVGSVVVGRKEKGEWRFTLARVNIRCQALWRHIDSTEISVDVPPAYIGELPTILPGMAGRHVFEVKPGRFLTRATGSSERAHTEQVFRVRSHFQGDHQDRLTLEAKNRSLCGETEPQTLNLLEKTVRLRFVELRMHPVDEGWLSVSRRLEVAPIDGRASKPAIVKDRSAQEAMRDQVLRHLAQRRVRVPARPSLDGLTVRISSAELRREGLLDVETSASAWSHVVKVAPGEGPFVPFGAFLREQRRGWVVLSSEGGALTASSRDVRPHTLDEFAAELSLPRKDVGVPSVPLYYAGIRQFHHGSSTGGRTHIFEWGLGERIELSEERLRSNGNNFDSFELTLFAGDEITSLVVDTDIIDIKGHRQSTISDLHELAAQAKDRMLHIVELSWENGSLTINAVRGLNRRASGDDHVVRFKHIWPTISMLSQQVLLPTLPPNARFSVLARLDQPALHQSRGTIAQFDIVDPTTDSSRPRRIRPGDIVFLWPRKVRRQSNDVVLELTYPVDDSFPLFTPQVPNALRRVEVSRRRFSAREDRLAKLAQALERRHTLLIPVAIMQQKGGVTQGALVNRDRRQVMARHESVLAASVREPTPTYAIVLRHDKRGIELELKVGVFVSLPNDRYQIAGSSQRDRHELRKGTIVYVKTQESAAALPGFVLTPTSSADHALVPAKGRRLAVGLPTNPMFTPPRRTETEAQPPPDGTKQHRAIPEQPNASISIGDLPNIIAAPESQVDGASIFAWMNQPHPKLVWLRRRYDEVTFSPAEIGDDAAQIRVGGLEIADGLPVMVPVRCTSAAEVETQPLPHFTPVPVSWLDLTFADQSAAAVADSTSRSTWSYHDEASAIWTTTDNEPRGHSFPLVAHSAASGPLNFAIRGDRARLRYTLDELDFVGLPTDVLFSDLARNDGKKAYPVAHPIRSADHPNASAPTGLWVEVGPGRVAELPGALCQWQTAAGAIALDEFAWGKFAAGDFVELELLRDDNPMLPDRIRLKGWRPGMRGALGTGRAFLPVAEHDLARGALQLGVGRWQVTLPVADKASAGMVALTQENELPPLPDQTPQPGDAVLLRLTEDVVRVSGFDDWRALADPRPPWEGNLELFGRSQNLVELLQLCGGSVPVQVAEWRSRDRVCTFVRASGLDRLPDRQLLQARMVGWHHGLSKVVLSVGAGLCTMPLRELVSGAADRWGPAICDALLQRNELIWFRMEDGKPLCGFRSLQSKEFEIAPLEALTKAGEGELEFGILCRIFGTGQFAWLAAENASLAGRLSRGEFERVLKAFRSHGAVASLWPARFTASDEVTVIHSRRIVEAFKRMSVGSSVSIRLLAKSEDDKFQLGADTRSNVVVRCTGAQDFKINDVFAGEVASLRRGRRLEVVPEGKRRVSFDLPAEMLDEFHAALDPKTSDSGPLPVPAAVPVLRFVERTGLALRGPTLQNCLQEAVALFPTDPKKAWQLLYKTGAAGLRSHHIIALAREWESAEAGGNIFWRQRATRLLREIFGRERHEGVTPPQIERIKYLLTSVEMRERTRTGDDDDLEASPAAASAPLLVAVALAASTGLLPPPDLWLRLIASNIELNTFLSWFRMYPTGTDETSRIDLVNMEANGGLSAHLDTGWYDIPLLQPIRLS